MGVHYVSGLASWNRLDRPPFSFFLMCLLPASTLGRTQATAPTHLSTRITCDRAAQRQSAGARPTTLHFQPAPRRCLSGRPMGSPGGVGGVTRCRALWVTGYLAAKRITSQGRNHPAPCAGSQACLVFRLGAWRGGAGSQDWGIWEWAGQRGTPAQAPLSDFHKDFFHQPSCRYYLTSVIH